MKIMEWNLSKEINKFGLNVSVTEKMCESYCPRLNATRLISFFYDLQWLESSQLWHQSSDHTFAIVQHEKETPETSSNHPCLIFTTSIPIVSPRQHGSFQTSIFVDGLDHLQTLIKGVEVILWKSCLLPWTQHEKCEDFLFGSEKQA